MGDSKYDRWQFHQVLMPSSVLYVIYWFYPVHLSLVEYTVVQRCIVMIRMERFVHTIAYHLTFCTKCHVVNFSTFSVGRTTYFIEVSNWLTSRCHRQTPQSHHLASQNHPNLGAPSRRQTYHNCP